MRLSRFATSNPTSYAGLDEGIRIPCESLDFPLVIVASRAPANTVIRLSLGKQARSTNMDEPLPRKADHQAAQSSSSTDKRKSQSPPSDSRSNPPQPVPTHIEPADKAAKRQSKRIDEANLAKLVAEENASRSKFPQYPGLERWELVEKMGDGAFSNVYRARDTTGQFGEVAIKVVRKYEMNNLQVSLKRLVEKCAARVFLSIVFTSSIIVAHITRLFYPVKQFFYQRVGIAPS